MAIQDWSDDITVAELGDDPQFTEDMAALVDALGEKPKDVLLNFAAVGYVNSSNVARLLRLRKFVMSKRRRLVLCDVNTQVWGIFLVTGLDKIFEFTNDVATALTMMQLASGQEQGGKA